MLGRRDFLAALGSLTLPSVASAAPAPYVLRDIALEGKIGKRMTLLVPEHTRDKVPLLVALHGLGETGDQKLGARAWVDRYGLASSYARLLSPPLTRVFPKYDYWDNQRLAEINASLSKRPFRGLAIACPYTPNVSKAPSRQAALDEYADWIVGTVIPRARSEARILAGSAHVYLDGCSMGGYVGIEVFLRKPTHFGAWGTLQGALGDSRIQGYADELADVIERHGKRHIHVETSKGDVFRRLNEQFSKMLTRAGVAHDFVMPPGPHNQPFLQDSGTVEMLLWHDRLPRRA
ncbi:MAG TPA: hypothetical protein VFB62_02175 [Polyangiaceae bacterium]|jgi:hypothetical protein|nr:hypothetical protein [Polyangiaceae bacterium]